MATKSDSVALSALKRSKIKSVDCSNALGRRVTSKGSNFDNSCKVVLHRGLGGGLRGGSSGSGSSGSIVAGKISLEDYIAELKGKPHPKWFEIVIVPEDLRRLDSSDNCTVNLAEDAQLTLARLLAALEIKHKIKKSFNGSFNKDNISFIRRYDRFHIGGEGVVLVDLTPERYQQDMLQIVEIIFAYFQFQSSGEMDYPCHVGELVNLLKNVNAFVSCFSRRQRSLVFNHIATWSVARQIEFFTSIVLYANSLLPPQNDVFKTLFEGEDFDKSWQCSVLDDDASVVMQNVYHYGFKDENGKIIRKRYSGTEYSQFEFGRTMLTHALKYMVMAKQVIASMYLVWSNQIFRVYKKLIAYTDDTATDATSSVPFSSKLQDIPNSDNMHLYQLLGFSEEPEN